MIKKDTHILGPFSFNEVLVKLTSGVLSSQNEVMAPLDRWRTLQSHPLYAAAVEKLRRQNDRTTSEYTMTKTERTSFTRTLDISFETMTPTPMRDTPPPLNQPESFMPEASVTSAKPLATPPVLQTSSKKMNLAPLLLVVALVMLGAIAAIFFNKKSPQAKLKSESKQENMVSYFDKGFAHKQRGEWQDAVKNFRSAYNYATANKIKDIDTIFELAPLLIQVEQHTEYARGLLANYMIGRYRAEEVCIGKNAIGLSYSYEGSKNKSNYDKAIKSYDECLNLGATEGVQPERVQFAQLNKGFALMMLGRFDIAETVLANTKTMQSQAMTPYLFIIDNYIHEGYAKNDRNAYQKAYNLASQVTNRRFYDGMQEILLFYAYAALKLGKDKNTVGQILERALYIDPDLTMEHGHPTLIDWRIYDWKQFDFICHDLRQINKSDLVALLEFTCSYKMNNEIGAQQALGGWFTRSQDKASMPHIAQAILSYRLGEVDKAKDSLLLAKKFGANDKLYYETLAKVCIRKKDDECLENNWEAIFKISPLYGYYVKAVLGVDKPSSIRKGLQESPHFLPLVRLQ
ncbi:MAG: hypothetical protein H6623_04960 [Bdellovibrionaceae bacterium]|nr:hypothetical protein [Pseudobdellovibrionaceae bacterium]